MNSLCKSGSNTNEYFRKFEHILDKMIKGMTKAELNDSISHNFIVQMIPHHRAAIEMSENILKYTKNIQLEKIATQIITEQTKSIENMRNIQCTCSELINSQREVCRYQQKVNQIMEVMFYSMKNSCETNRINCDFLREMIPHHKGAVEMSNNALRYNICPELKPVLEAIITSQKMGIKQMQNLLKCLNCQ